MTKKALELKDNIPGQYSTPAIKSRISILITNVSLLDMYLHLTQIPHKKVVNQVAEINLELIALQREMDKIDQKDYLDFCYQISQADSSKILSGVIFFENKKV